MNVIHIFTVRIPNSVINIFSFEWIFDPYFLILLNNNFIMLVYFNSFKIINIKVNPQYKMKNLFFINTTNPLPTYQLL